MQTFDLRLESEWFDTADSLRKIPEEEWAEFKLPSRLLIEIQHELSARAAEVPAKKQMQTNLVSGPPPSVQQILGDLSLETATVANFISALSSLHTIVSNVIKDPMNPVKRRLRLSNPAFHTKVGQYKNAIKLLAYVRFLCGIAVDRLRPHKRGRACDARG